MPTRNDIPDHLFPVRDRSEENLLGNRLDLEAQDHELGRVWQKEADKESGRAEVEADIKASNFTKLGLYARHQILAELQRMGYKIITVSGLPASPEEAKTHGGITSDAGATAFRQASKNLADRGVRSEYTDR